MLLPSLELHPGRSWEVDPGGNSALVLGELWKPGSIPSRSLGAPSRGRGAHSWDTQHSRHIPNPPFCSSAARTEGAAFGIALQSSPEGKEKSPTPGSRDGLWVSPCPFGARPCPALWCLKKGEVATGTSHPQKRGEKVGVKENIPGKFIQGESEAVAVAGGQQRFGVSEGLGLFPYTLWVTAAPEAGQ